MWLRLPCVYKVIQPKHKSKFQEEAIIIKVVGKCLVHHAAQKQACESHILSDVLSLQTFGVALVLMFVARNCKTVPNKT